MEYLVVATLKQLEAFIWVGRLGTFEAAADRLHLAQSTVSKRVAELEAGFADELLHRTGRRPVLTARGEEVREIAEEMLHLHDRLAALARPGTIPSFRFRLGVTDLIALSWMPLLLEWLEKLYPQVTIEPEIDLSATLLTRLSDRRLDFVVCPSTIRNPRFAATELGYLELVWMASPKILNGRRSLSKGELAALPLLAQNSASIMHPALSLVLDDPDLVFVRRISCNNMAALAHLAAHGMGVTLLPKAFFRNFLDDERLVVIECDTALPRLEYFATYNRDGHTDFCSQVAEICSRVCNMDS
ncbi:LysR family transcriptional regulator [Aureimonas sp. AU20]|uniref:LysR family transcriptional regulator n=1 Tax=Aureimonas sp. AU20 TaxID=1349819 RepID=UPI0007219C8C|nr:LysR family transcriptional regulator [Aureimonas sp. AU20]ALN71842.1 hypothetical protein M673_03895 [Aureimonas sp. AU20]